MKNNFLKNQQGVTLLELLMVIGITAILSVWFISGNRPTDHKKLIAATTTLANDLRVIRNLAVSRVAYNGVYPGGYGIKFYNSNGTTIPPKYILFAGTDLAIDNSNAIKTVVMTGNAKFRLGDPNAAYTDSLNNSNWTGTFVFNSEDSVTVGNINQDSLKQYRIALQYVFRGVNNIGYNDQSILTLGQEAADGFEWGNIGVSNTNVLIPTCDRDGVLEGLCEGNPGLSRAACLAAHYIWLGEQCDDGPEGSATCTINCTIISSPSNRGGGHGVLE